MKILHFINNINLSWYTMLTDTLTAQQEAGHEVVAVVPPWGVNHKRLVRDGYPAVALPVRSSKLDYLAAWKLSKLLREEKADVLHTHLTSSALLGSAAARWAGVPCVASVLKMTNKRHYMRCDRLLPCSDAVMENLAEQGVPESMMKRIYTGINIDRFMEGFEGTAEARKEFGYNSNDIVLGIVARLVPMKGHEILLDAMPEVFESHPEARLLVVGDGELRPGLEEQAAKLGIRDKVIFAGTRYDLQNILESIDYSVMSSVGKEGLPVALVQTVLAGKPAIMTDVAGIREIVEDGRTGYLAPPGDAGALSAAICRALEDPEEAKRRAQTARDFVSREFDVHHTAGLIEKVYSELAGDHPGSG